MGDITFMKITFGIMIILLISSLQAAYFSNLETSIEQPDGVELKLLATGDEYYNWLHDQDGYTIIQSQSDGYYYYAQEDGEILIPTIYKALSIDPESTGLKPGLKFPASYIQQKREMMAVPLRNDLRPLSRTTLNNLAVYISFSDQEEFEEPRSVFDQKFNDTDPDSISLRNYYTEVSYDQLDLVTSHFPESPPEISISYQDSHPRAYFLPYNEVTNPDGYQYWERTEREHQLLADAIEFISDQVPEELNIDYNNDGYVDNVCFIIRGVHSAWADLLWAHRWALYNNNAYINGLQVWDYTFQPENQNTVRVLAHEMFHALGAPDLYHYNFDGISPAGPWDVMESGFVHMGAHMKMKYGGWIDDIPEITESGWYHLNPLYMEENNCYKILSPNSPNEYFVLEYRRRDPDTFDRNIPGSGLLVTRIVEGLNGNSGGPPDEVYIYRVDGTTTANGSIVKAHFSMDEARTEINDHTNPSSFLSTGNSGGLNINAITYAEETISFYVSQDLTWIPPILNITLPAEDAILPVEDILISLDIEDLNYDIINMELYIDDEFTTSFLEPPFEFLWEVGDEDLGVHKIFAQAMNEPGFATRDEINVTIIDPTENNWFEWYTEEPDYRAWGRGVIPIKAAVDFNLGEIEYYVKQVSLNIEEDPYGSAPVPGEVFCQIVELDDFGITENVLIDIGSFNTPMDGRYVHDVYSDITVSGTIAVTMDISSYQNILFDQEGVTGHSWLTEPDRPWVDALSRGVLGAADIGVMLSTDPTYAEDELIPENDYQLSNYPNPFNPVTMISFHVSEELDTENVELIIYNLKGQKVKNFGLSNLESGINEVVWNGTDNNNRSVPSGIYLYKLKTASGSLNRKMLLLK
jgi:M6 family metalloprotease-like protein